MMKKKNKELDRFHFVGGDRKEEKMFFFFFFFLRVAYGCINSIILLPKNE
jgi:hypothetical protein